MGSRLSFPKIFLTEVIVFIVSGIALIYSLNHFLNTKYTLDYWLVVFMAVINVGILAYGSWWAIKLKNWVWLGIFILSAIALTICWFYAEASISLGAAFQNVQF